MANLDLADRVLVVDDTPTNLFILYKLLSNEGYHVVKANGGSAALEIAKSYQPTLILLDIMMPQINGYEVCRQLRATPETADIPIIFLSSLDAPFDKVKAFKAGAADYVTKPFQPEEVLARVRHQTALRRATAEQQHLNEALETRVKERTQLLELAHNQLLEVALTDRLTRLPNRLSFVKRLSTVMAEAQLSPTTAFAVLFLDCDRFKRVNDSLGHRIGDQLLRGVARRLTQLKQDYAKIEVTARFGGDEFALLLTHVMHKEAVVTTAESILKALSQPFFLAGQDIYINASIGMVWGDDSYVAAEHLLRDADVAMYEAKDCSRGGQYRWFESGMRSEAVQLLQLETDMRLALERQEFRLHYQPIVDLERMKVIGFEALVRWQHPTRGLIGPDKFIRFAEESGFITELGTQVLWMACRDLANWERSGRIDSELSVSINVAPEQLLAPNILTCVEKIIQATGVSSHRLRFELTERSIISDHAVVGGVLEAFKTNNIKISIDDFGTGYSALSYLHTLPVDCLKVDRSFVQPITAKSGSLGIVPLIINMAETMNMGVVAEGIETVTQLRQLQKLGCKYGQGFLFQRALPAAQALALLDCPLEEWNEWISVNAQPRTLSSDRRTEETNENHALKTRR
ncbi:MAG: EAL domain-containing protein [Cyanobacteria bacterium J06598_1]